MGKIIKKRNLGMKIRVFVWSLILPLIFGGFLGLSNTPAQSINRAGLVVQFSDDKIDIYCISFVEENFSGEDLLDQYSTEIEAPIEKMLDPINGAAICKIGNVGCPSDDCFCDSPPNNWSYWYLQDEEWVYSSFGASNRNIYDGDVDGWRWGASFNPPKLMTFDEICNPTPTPTNTPTFTYTPKPTNSPRLTNTPKPKPTETPIPTNTPKPEPTETPFPIKNPPIPPTVNYSPSNNPTLPPTPTEVHYPSATSTHTPTLSPTVLTSYTVEPSTKTLLATTAPTIINLLNTNPNEKTRVQSKAEEGGLPSKATDIVLPTSQTTLTHYPDSTSGTTLPILSTVRNVIDFLQNLISTVYSP